MILILVFLLPIMFSRKENVKGGESDKEIGADVSGGERGRALIGGAAFALIEGQDHLVVESGHAQKSGVSIAKLGQIF